MTPAELARLRDLSNEASAVLQEIQGITGRESVEEAIVRFPRGFLRPAAVQRARFPFIDDDDLKANLAYTLILSDAVYWLLIRTDIAATAREMLIKLFIFLGGAMIESITKNYLYGLCGRGFRDRNQYLVDAGIITPQLKTDLDWVWDMRNNMHLFLLEEREYNNDYTLESQQRCTRAFKGLVETLAARGRLGL